MSWERTRLRLTRRLSPSPQPAAPQHEDPRLRMAESEAPGTLGDPNAGESLRSALRDKDWTTRKAACQALGQLGDPRAVEPLLTALRDEDWNVREAAAAALAAIGRPAVEPLLAALKGGDWMAVRRAGPRCWGGSAISGPWSRCWERSDTATSSVRKAVCQALGQLGDPRAVGPLTAMLKDSHEEVRRVRCRSVGRARWDSDQSSGATYPQSFPQVATDGGRGMPKG